MATATRTRAKRGTGKAKPDSYEVVTDLIIDALEQGVVPWARPWKAAGQEGLPRSLSSRKPYRGVNVWTLTVTAMLRGYESPWWGTYKQIGERGGQVRKGEKGTPVVFFRPVEIKDPDDATKKKTILILKHFVVFNADQADDTKVPQLPGADVVAEEEFEPIEVCEMIRDGYLARSGGLRLRHSGDAAYYSPTLDLVNLPKPAAFETAETYYGALFHEFGHSTGVEQRLNRKGSTSGRYGSEPYAKEELVAEMTAAYCCGDAGIEINIPLRAGYISNWLQALRGDKKLVVSAGAAAQKAADLILGREPESNGEEQS